MAGCENTMKAAIDPTKLPTVNLVNSGPVALAGLLIAAGAAYLAAEVTWRQSLLFLVGVFAGLALDHGAFGFTSSWRALIAHGRGAGVRAQMLMLAITCALFQSAR